MKIVLYFKIFTNRITTKQVGTHRNKQLGIPPFELAFLVFSHRLLRLNHRAWNSFYINREEQTILITKTENRTRSESSTSSSQSAGKVLRGLFTRYPERRNKTNSSVYKKEKWCNSKGLKKTEWVGPE